MKAFLMNLLKNKAKNKVAELSGKDSKSFFSPVYKYAIYGSIGFLFFIVIIVVIIVIIFGPVMMTEQYFEDKKNSVGLFFEKVGNFLTFNGWCSDTDGSCQANSEQKYFDKLNSVYDSYKDDGVDLDTDLITGTIFYGSTFTSDKFSDDIGDDDSDTLVDSSDVHLSDISKLASNMVSGSSIDYEKYYNYLINTYIPKRFSNLYSSDSEKEKIADEMMLYARQEYKRNSNIAGNCSFEQSSQTSQSSINVDRNYIDSVYVNVLNENCNDVGICGSDIEQTVSLRDYVVGVAYREIHAGYESRPDETVKALMVAIKGFTLGRRKVVQDGDKYYATMRNNTNDQVFCNIKTGCMHYKTKNILPAATDSQKELLYRLYDEVYNDLLYNTSEKKFWGAYTASKASCLSGPKLSTNCMSQNEALSMGEKGSDYKSILSAFYTQNIVYYDISTSSISTGSYVCHNNGSGIITGNTYTSNPPNYENISDLKNNYNSKYYFGSYFQCVWFARGRAQEIILNSNMPEDLKQKAFKAVNSTRGNGESWYSNPSLAMFNKSTDLYAAKPGSIVSWSGGSVWCKDISDYCGHVGIIEDVKYDENGRAKSVIFSDSWNNAKSGIGYRKREVSMDKLKIYNPNYVYRFNGYVYLLD